MKTIKTITLIAITAVCFFGITSGAFASDDNKKHGSDKPACIDVRHGHNNNGGESEHHRNNCQDRPRNMPAPVPEPGTIVAALSVLAPAGFLFSRKRA